MNIKLSKLNLVYLISILLLTLQHAQALAHQTPEIIERYNHVVFKGTLNKADGNDVLIREAFFPAGWKAPRHYHNSSLFIYVIEGEFEVQLAGSEQVTYKAGQGLQMKAGVEMEARNPSSTHSLKLAVFQVGKPNAAFVVPVN